MFCHCGIWYVLALVPKLPLTNIMTLGMSLNNLDLGLFIFKWKCNSPDLAKLITIAMK